MKSTKPILFIYSFCCSIVLLNIGNCGTTVPLHPLPPSRPKEANDIKEILANDGGGRIGRVWLKPAAVLPFGLGKAQGFNDKMK